MSSANLHRSLRDQDGNNRQRLGPDRWEARKIYVDEHPFTVPKDAGGATMTVLTGIWKADARLRIVAGPYDGDNRAIVGKIQTGLGSGPSPVAHR
jgi:hypothetical protein